MNFLPETSLSIQFAIAAIILAVTPGPDMTLFIGRALSEGRAAGIACMLGAVTGLFIHTILVAVGLSALILASPKAFLVLKIVGAAYLVWLAYQALRHGSAFSPETMKRKSRPLFQNWMAGIGINLLNPKIVLFFLTFLPQFVSASDPYAPQKLMFFGLLFMLISIPSTVPLILIADKFAAAMRENPRITRVIDWLFAGVFSAFAVKILLADSK